MSKRIVTCKKNNVDHKIEMSWGMFFKNFTVSFDGEVLGVFKNQKELNLGRDFTLPSGEILRVKKTQKIMTMLIETLINGVPIEGTDSDPRKLLEKAYHVAILLCVLNLVVGFLGYFVNLEFLSAHGYGLYNLVIGTLYFLPIILGVKQKSWPMLIFIFTVFLIDTASAFYWIIEMNKQGVQVNGGSLVARFIFGVPLFLGVKAGYSLRNNIEELGSERL